MNDIIFTHGLLTIYSTLNKYNKLKAYCECCCHLLEVKHSAFILGNGLSQKSSSEVRAYMDCLHVIDNQQTLFELSHRLEPRA